MKRKTNRKGFTLIELIVVVAVLAILAAIAIPVASDLVNTAKKNSDEANVALYQSAIERYNAEGNSYPTAVDDVRNVIKKYTNTTKISAPKGKDYHFYYATGAITVSGTTYRLGQVFLSTTDITSGNFVLLDE